MWELLWACMADRRVALCIPWQGEAIPLIYWYGVLAAVGIFVGAWIAAKHMEREGEDPNIIWDALLWILIPALIGGRLWYVAAEVLGGSTAYSFSRPLEIINPRAGGMNIFGGAVAGAVAMLIYARAVKAKSWLLMDAGLLGLLVGQGIGRFGNFINQELYGPPTGSDWFGMTIPDIYRLSAYRSLPAETLFHPTMLYEAAWLFLSFGVLFYLFNRYQSRFIQGVLAGLYLIFAGLGRFVLEVVGLRPDQPEALFGQTAISISIVLSMVYVVFGLIIVLDRYGYVKLPFIKRPQTMKQREATYESLLRARLRAERAKEREAARNARRKERDQRRSEGPRKTAAEPVAEVSSAQPDADVSSSE